MSHSNRCRKLWKGLNVAGDVGYYHNRRRLPRLFLYLHGNHGFPDVVFALLPLTLGGKIKRLDVASKGGSTSGVYGRKSIVQQLTFLVSFIGVL